MTHFEAKMSTKGQITVPAALRNALELKEGDTVDFYFDADLRSVRMRVRNKPLGELFGLLKDADLEDKGPLTPEAMDEAIAAAVQEDHDRIIREYKEWQEFQEWKRKRGVEAAE